MPLIPLADDDDDDPAFLFRLRHIADGAVRYVRPRQVHVVKLDGWFGARWMYFAGTRHGKDVHLRDRLALPPFAPKRVVRESTFQRDGKEVRKVTCVPLHESPIALKHEQPNLLERIAESGVFIWYSGNTAKNDRGSLMVYNVHGAAEQSAWYTELQRRNGVWVVSTVVDTSVDEVHGLETAYGNRLSPLFQRPLDEQQEEDRRLWRRALDATYESVAQATVLVDRYRQKRPDDPFGALLYGHNRAAMRQFDDAERALKSVENSRPEARWRAAWLMEWGNLMEKSDNRIAAEAAYRELTELRPGRTPPWIYLGACLAVQGKLKEAEAVHRHATTLEGDPDEAFLNLGLVLRGQARFEEAASAFEEALRLDPDYSAAREALEDVRAALRIQDEV